MKQTFIRYNTDKYQRIGLLKILVAFLDPQRRSQAKELISRKLTKALLEYVHNNSIKKYRVEFLIQDADSPSWNFRFTVATISEILEWGKLYGFLGLGNQITERGLLLRTIMGEDAILSIRKGDFIINPFHLTLAEKIYFLYHHLEIDTSLFFLLKRLGTTSKDIPIRGIEADRLSCFAFYDLYRHITNSKSFSKNYFAIRGLKEIIGRMASELGLKAEIPIQLVIKPKSSSSLRAKPDQQNKKRTKTSDHEAIPRFEFLTDLFLLEKRSQALFNADIEEVRKAWLFWPTPNLLKFANALPADFSVDYRWNGFASNASMLFSDSNRLFEREKQPSNIALRANEAYSEVKRQFGHTPMESVALATMIRALTDSVILEMKDIYEVFLSFKKDNLFSESVRFAAGNELDKMFIDIKPTFVSEVNKYYGN